MAYQRSKHERKYDRQMRLWGGHGQARIEESHICVLGGGPTATESLKNLVLPNIGTFTVVDDGTVCLSDLGNNFFVTQDKIGTPRAECIRDNMLEMNPSCTGHFDVRSPSHIIQEDIEFLSTFNMVIATNLYGADYLTLADYLYTKKIPLLAVRTNGLMGQFRIQMPELCIIESHPSDIRTDLYISQPQLELFPELKDFLLSFAFDAEDKDDIPAPALAVKAALDWMDSHDGNLPSTFAEKKEFKAPFQEEITENYKECYDCCFQAYSGPRSIPEINTILDSCEYQYGQDCDLFWVMVRGLKDFMTTDNNGYLPVNTTIPDFHTDSNSYVTLKNLYKEKALQHQALVLQYIKARMQELGRNEDEVDDSFLIRFVKNCRNLHVEQYRSINEEYENPIIEEIQEQTDEFDMMSLQFTEEELAARPKQPKLVQWYFAFRGCDDFYTAHGRLPGDSEDLVGDKNLLTAAVNEYLTSKGVDRDGDEDCIAEMVRYGGSEPHTVAAVMGGIVSQEALKIILRQYSPYNHTAVFEGVHCRLKTMKF